jgi:hypothetical protein
VSKGNSGKVPGHLYHVTIPENESRIDEEGLVAQVSQAVSNDPRFDRDTEVVYGFADKQDAIDFANDNGAEGNYVIYRIDTSGLKVKPDPEYESGQSYVIIGDVKPRKLEKL